MLSTLSILLIISLVIVIHESGHYLSCRFFKTPVDEFSIFIGPKIFTLFYYKETEFTLRLIPIGGFIKIRNPEKGKPLERIIVSSAGPFANFLTGLIIIMAIFVFKGSGITDSIFHACKIFGMTVSAFIPALGDITNNIQGPIGIGNAGSQYIKEGIIPTLVFISVLNYSICLINLIPIPILDGFQIVLSTIELVTKRKVNEKVVLVMHLMGACAVFTLILFAFYNDIINLF